MTNGYQILTDAKEVVYLETQFYYPDWAGVNRNNPGFKLELPNQIIPEVMSDKERFWPNYKVKSKKT